MKWSCQSLNYDKITQPLTLTCQFHRLLYSRLKDEKLTVVHFLKIHVLKVIDHSPILTELPPAYDYDEESNSARCHTFTCHPGTIDGAERAYIGGGHGFAGPGSDGRADALFRM